jgi:transposase
MEAPVIEWERRVRLKHYLRLGYSQTAIAEELGIDRRTIYRWIRSGQLDRDLSEPPRYSPRPPRPRKLDPFREYLRQRLGDFPDLTATRLLREIRASGYTGGITQLRDFVREIRPHEPEEPVTRFETPPGKQAQVDFAHFRFPWGTRYALVVVLGYSRALWFQYFRRQDLWTLIRGLEQAFQFFGGVPEEILFDQMRAVVSRDLRPHGGRLIENAEFLRFAAHHGFRPRACRPYRAKTKGKVERPIRYIRQDFHYGRSFANDPDANDQALLWLKAVANLRVHATTGERPIDRLEVERQHLKPLQPSPYRSLVLEPTSNGHSRSVQTSVPRIAVERRPLTAYAQIVVGGDA